MRPRGAESVEDAALFVSARCAVAEGPACRDANQDVPPAAGRVCDPAGMRACCPAADGARAAGDAANHSRHGKSR